MIVILHRLSWQNDSLREGAEEFLSNVSSTRAVIQQLNFLGFYPNIKIDVENVVFQEIGDPTNALMTMEALEFSMPFSHYVFNKKTLENISIKNFQTEGGFPFDKALLLKAVNLKTSKEEAAGAIFEFNGEYGGDTFKGFMPLMSVPYKPGRPLYKLGQDVPFEFISDSFSVFTTLHAGKKQTTLNDFRFVRDGQDVLSGSVILKGKKGMHIAADLKSGESIFQINSETATHEDNTSMNISIVSDAITVRDLEQVVTAFKGVTGFLYDDLSIFTEADLSIDFDLKSLSCANGSAGYKGAIVQGQIKAMNDLTESHPCTTYLNEFLQINDTVNEG